MIQRPRSSPFEPWGPGALSCFAQQHCHHVRKQLSFIPADVGRAEVREHRETHASRVRNGRLDPGDRVDGQELSRPDDLAVRRPGNIANSRRHRRDVLSWHASFQFELLRDSWHELFILTAAQYFSDTDISLLYEEHRSAFGSPDIGQLAAQFKETLTAVKRRQIDPIEQYLLNEIVLLKSGNEPRAPCPGRIRPLTGRKRQRKLFSRD